MNEEPKRILSWHCEVCMEDITWPVYDADDETILVLLADEHVKECVKEHQI